MRLIFIRHGQTEWNRQDRYQGRTDVPLCAAGVAEAHAAGAALRGCGASLLLSSPLERARATAQIIAARLGPVACQVDDRLIELGFGAWEGRTQTEIKERWPALLRAWKRAPQSIRFPGGESLEEASRRLEDFLGRPPWSGVADHRCVIVVTHTGPIRMAKLAALGRPLSEYRRLALERGAAHEFERDPTGRLRPAGLHPLT
jgi:broad specificity phosphatase PhoE